MSGDSQGSLTLVGLADQGEGLPFRCGLFLGLPLQLDGRLEVGPILHRDAFGLDLTVEVCLLGDLHLATGFDVAGHPTADGHVVGVDIGLHLALGTHGEVVLLQLDATLYRAIDDQIPFALDAALNGDLLANDGLFPHGGGRHVVVLNALSFSQHLDLLWKIIETF